MARGGFYPRSRTGGDGGSIAEELDWGMWGCAQTWRGFQSRL
ncbi:hypothetical protein predicted by Glimmer/Critica [Acetobacter senegalensis]|uniref:Uncharacterized protein n=1 Tax=Acetobacter senegalensis TaxID=446692 RepID=A0A0U5ERA4_9PROT|nr:hypothetical protein predicted by Glimmer/Critica [Acetobacter senegalensis]